MAEPQLTVAHQVIANALGFVVALAADDDRLPMVIDAIEEALPHAERNSMVAERLVSAAFQVVAAWPMRRKGKGGPVWALAIAEARGVVTDFLFWRGGLAQARMRELLSAQPNQGA